MEGVLEMTPVFDGGFEPVILLGGESEADGFAFDLARPLVVGTTGAGSAVLDLAFADPAGAGEGLGEFGKALAARSRRRRMGHQSKSLAYGSIRRYIYRS